MGAIIPTVFDKAWIGKEAKGHGGNTIPRSGLEMYIRAPGMTDIIGLSVISGTWPNCVVQAIADGPLEDFGPFAGAAQVNFATLPQDISNQFFWGGRGYAFYSTEQHISVVKRILSYFNSDAFVDYIYVGSDQLFVGSEPVAAVFGA
jgi:hypothetical protein